jgi:MFS family permease
MNSNLWLILSVSVFFGLATGIYEFVLPPFLKTLGISFGQMGVIFAIAGAAMVLVRIYMGGLSDLWGRKPLYGAALFACAIGTASPMVISGMVAQ